MVKESLKINNQITMKMARSKCHNTMRFLLTLVLIICIVKGNLGGTADTIKSSNGTALNANYSNSELPTEQPWFETELSSPVPFATRSPALPTEISTKPSLNLDLIATDKQQANATKASDAEISAKSPKASSADGNTDDAYEKELTKLRQNTNEDFPKNAKANQQVEFTAAAADYDELKSLHDNPSTTPTSMEQQDGPVMPPATTITFKNVAAVSILDDGDSEHDNRKATPPIDAVDEKYGKTQIRLGFIF